jgi:hypothetical protein
MGSFDWNRLFVKVMLIAATVGNAGATDCGVPPDPNKGKGLYVEERNLNCLQDPGWFDVGAGIAVIRNADLQGQNGIGNMVTVRGYPFGRWYAPLKTLTPTGAGLVAAKTAIANAKQIEAAEAQQQANKAQAKATSSGFAADKDKADSEQAGADELKAEADKATTNLALSMQNALNDFGSSYAIYEDSGWAQFYKRIAFFYGRSVGGFDTNAVEGDINAFGITFDIAPQMSLAWGRAFYNRLPQNGVASSAAGTVFSIQINLNAFKTMRGLTGSL